MLAKQEVAKSYLNRTLKKSFLHTIKPSFSNRVARLARGVYFEAIMRSVAENLLKEMVMVSLNGIKTATIGHGPPVTHKMGRNLYRSAKNFGSSGRFCAK